MLQLGVQEIYIDALTLRDIYEKAGLFKKGLR
jgi:hypothetical protein